MSPSALEVVVTDLHGRPGQQVLVVGPSLGTRVDRLWAKATAELDDLHVVGWDLPGHGLSPAVVEGFTLGDLAGAVLAAVDGAVGAEAAATPYLYAGDSVGGAVGLQLLLDHPARFRGASALCSAARFGTPRAWAERAALVRAQGMAPMVASSPDRWFGRRVRAEPTDLSRAAVDDLASVDPESYALVCEALGRFDVTARLGEIAIPFLAIAGADDVVTPAAQHQRLARAVTNGRFAVLRGVGHLAPLEDAVRTAALLREHFSRALTPCAAGRRGGAWQRAGDGPGRAAGVA